ncbi:Uma2 family endonuclease [Uniformispora flossi]|uniref:Uma2 family endonuclease n=1 Tax=Uniformispora flossi TaxID=3390723 RepID=UPI003C2E8BD9
MTVMVEAKPDNHIPDLLDDFDTEFFRVEYVEGRITVTPSPAHYHEHITHNVLWQLWQANMMNSGIGARGFCKTANCGDTAKGNHVIPDFWAARRDFTEQEITASELHRNWISADALDLVGEVTSTHRRADTRDKLTAYSRMSIPHYLLIDRTEHTVTLYSDPTGDVDVPAYGTKHTVKFGDPVPMPDGYPTLDSTTWQ